MSLTAALPAVARAADAGAEEESVALGAAADNETAVVLGEVPAETDEGSAEEAITLGSDDEQQPTQVEGGEPQELPVGDGSAANESAADDVDTGVAGEQEGASADSTTTSTPASDVGADGSVSKTPAAASKPDAKVADQTTAAKQQATSVTLAAQAAKGAALPAGAANVRNGIYVIETSVANNKVLGNPDKAPQETGGVRSWTYTGTNGQKWEVVKDSASGWYHILSCVDKSLCIGMNAYHTVMLVKTATCGDRGLWAFVANGSWYNLVNRSLTDQFLTLFKSNGTREGAGVGHVPKSAAGEEYARFYLLEATPKVSPGATGYTGSFSVIPTTNTTLVAEVRGANKANDANVWLWTDKSGEHQHIYFEPDGKGFYTAWIVGTGKVVAQQNASICPGNNVLQKAFRADDDTQKWGIRPLGDGSISLVNKATGLALGICGTASGSNLVGTRNDTYKTTRFILTRRSLLSAGIVEIRPRTSSAVTLDVKSGVSSGYAPLILWSRKNVLNQKFELVSAGGTDMWRIRTASSGGWICQSGSGILQSGVGSTARSNWSTWMAVYSGGWYSFVNLASGKALDMRYGKTTNGTEIISWGVNGRDSQHFNIVHTGLVSPGCYMLQNGGGKYLEAAGSSSSSDHNARVNAKGASAGQVVDIQGYGGDWTIRGITCGRYLTASATSVGANVLFERRNTASRAQLWVFEIADGGRIAIRNAANPKLALDATSGGSSNGANVVAYTYRSQNNQAWKPQAAFNDGALSAKQQAVVSACKTTPSPGQGWCAAWVTNVFANARVGSWYGDACDHYDSYCKSSDLASIRPGMIVAVRTHPKSSAGSMYGHVGIYIGGGMMMDNVGTIRTISVLEWIDYYGGTCTPKWGWFGGKSLA